MLPLMLNDGQSKNKKYLAKWRLAPLAVTVIVPPIHETIFIRRGSAAR